MKQIYSPQTLAELLSRPRDILGREERDHLFYSNQDKLELTKIEAGLKGLGRPRLTFNILNELDQPKVIKSNINICLDIYREDIDRIESQLLSGESPIDEQVELKTKLSLIQNKESTLQNNLKSVDFSTTGFLHMRGFLPIGLLNHSQYIKFITTSDNIPLVGINNFDRVLLNSHEYEYFDLLFSSATSLDKFLELCHKFIETKIAIKKIALCSYEHANNAFNVYFGKGNIKAIEVISLLKKKYPNHIQYLSELNYWTIRESLRSSDLESISVLFDAWFDCRNASIYTKKDINLDFNLNTLPCTNYNPQYVYGILFDYMNTPVKIGGNELLETLSVISPHVVADSILFFDGVSFNKGNNDIIWTYAEMVLIQYKCETEPDLEFLAIYSAIEKNILFSCENIGHIADKCLLLFKNTISLLNINAFEQVNPSVILKSS